MNKLNKGAALLMATVGLLAATPSQATPYRLDFTASNFVSAYYGTNPVQQTISGDIEFSASSLGAQVDAIKAVHLVIDGYSYTNEDIEMEAVAGTYFIGGKLNGWDSIGWGTNDFYFFTFQDLNSFTYSSSSVFDGWIAAANDVQFSYSVVPEPTSGALMLGALGALALARRRRQVK